MTYQFIAKKNQEKCDLVHMINIRINVELKFYLVRALKLLLKNYFVPIKQYLVSWYEKKLR